MGRSIPAHGRRIGTAAAVRKPERHAQRQGALLDQGKNAEAAAAWQRALELDPKNAVFHNNRAVALDKDGKKQDALAAFREAVRLKPDYVDALHNLGNALRHMKRPAEAEEVYRQALKPSPTRPTCATTWASHCCPRPSTRRPRPVFGGACALEPNLAEAHNNLGGCASSSASWTTPSRLTKRRCASNPMRTTVQQPGPGLAVARG